MMRNRWCMDPSCGLQMLSAASRSFELLLTNGLFQNNLKSLDFLNINVLTVSNNNIKDNLKNKKLNITEIFMISRKSRCLHINLYRWLYWWYIELMLLNWIYKNDNIFIVTFTQIAPTIKPTVIIRLCE